jgi:SAM-dependent methyltransferase
MSDYREELYTDYATDFKGGSQRVCQKKIDEFWPIFKQTTQGWLPESKISNILDIGCGNGTNMNLLKNKAGYCNVYGVDFSKSQVSLAQQHVANVQFGNALDYLDDSSIMFDLILAFDLIEHLTKKEALKLIKLCFEKLNPGGRIIFQTPNASSPFFGSVRYGDFTHELGFTPHLLSQLLERDGFVDVKQRETGPLARGYSIKSSIRYILWQLIRNTLCLYTIIETGSCRDKIFTRVFVQSAVKPSGVG